MSRLVKIKRAAYRLSRWSRGEQGVEPWRPYGLGWRDTLRDETEEAEHDIAARVARGESIGDSTAAAPEGMPFWGDDEFAALRWSLRERTEEGREREYHHHLMRARRDATRRAQ